MAYLKYNKLNHLLTKWPSGTVYTSAWLRRRGFSTALLSQYRSSKWILSIGRGADIRPGEKVAWTGGLYAIQEQLSRAVHAGGKTALQLHGYAHFLPMGQTSVAMVFSSPKIRLPEWFLRHDFHIKIIHVATKIFLGQDDLGLTKKELGSYSIKISSPERAIMEVLHLVPNKESYEESKLLMEGLITLRPALIQKLLENCRSIKVKRLFMHLAQACNLPWVKKINLDNIDFGKGKRVLCKGGYFDSKYKISVPGKRIIEG